MMQDSTAGQNSGQIHCEQMVTSTITLLYDDEYSTRDQCQLDEEETAYAEGFERERKGLPTSTTIDTTCTLLLCFGCYQLKDVKLKDGNRMGKDKGSAEMKESREKEFYASIFAGQKQAEQVRNQLRSLTRMDMHPYIHTYIHDNDSVVKSIMIDKYSQAHNIGLTQLQQLQLQQQQLQQQSNIGGAGQGSPHVSGYDDSTPQVRMYPSAYSPRI